MGISFTLILITNFELLTREHIKLNFLKLILIYKYTIYNILGLY